MQSIKIESEYISSLANLVQYDSTIVKIENVNDGRMFQQVIILNIQILKLDY